MVANNTIAQTIWDEKTGGFSSFGSSSGTATDANGHAQTVRFTRATIREIYVDYDLETEAGFSASTFKAEVAKLANEKFGVGKSVLIAFFYTFALQQPKVTNVTGVRIGFTASPVGTADLTGIGARDIPRFDSSRITT
jgi:hypothetical protein